MFLGSNIGNFQRDQAVDFFRRIRTEMNENDRLFSASTCRRIPRYRQRYDDPSGVTAAFNLNLLRRINVNWKPISM